MSFRSVFYAFWCAIVLALFAFTGVFAWSPFAEGSGTRPHSGFYGPTHK